MTYTCPQSPVNQHACMEAHLSQPISYVDTLAWDDFGWGFKESSCWPWTILTILLKYIHWHICPQSTTSHHAQKYIYHCVLIVFPGKIKMPFKWKFCMMHLLITGTSNGNRLDRIFISNLHFVHGVMPSEESYVWLLYKTTHPCCLSAWASHILTCSAGETLCGVSLYIWCSTTIS